MLRAALLAGIIIAAAAFISAVFIVIHSTARGMASERMPNIPLSEISASIPEQPVPAPPEQPPPLSGRHAGERPASAQPVQRNPEKTETAPAAKPEVKPVEKPAGNSRHIPEKPAPAVPKPPAEKPPVEKPAAPAPARPAAPPRRPQPPEHKGTLVFIIDDAGNNLAELEPFLRFPGPLTIAVLPGLPHSAQAAQRIRAAGKEVFLHQPMEALGGQAPGPGAIYTGMSEREIRELLRRNVAEIGPVAGMNNHQGSKITSDQKMMEAVLDFCREQGIYFLDSRTTADTQAPAAAKSLGMKIGERNIFIDNDQEKNAMSRSIKEGLGKLRDRGGVVMIGHAWSPALAPLLAELYPSLLEQGYTFSVASKHIANGKN
jgi:polysaccharide deacetylase 2 family uncharacterized protein YibQ